MPEQEVVDRTLVMTNSVYLVQKGSDIYIVQRSTGEQRFVGLRPYTVGMPLYEFQEIVAHCTSDGLIQVKPPQQWVLDRLKEGWRFRWLKELKYSEQKVTILFDKQGSTPLELINKLVADIKDCLSSEKSLEIEFKFGE